MKVRLLRKERAARAVLLILLISLAGMGKGFGQGFGFSAVCESGQLLYYSIIDPTNNKVEVVHPSDDPENPWGGYDTPSGELVIPNKVKYEGNTYTVSSIGESAFAECNLITSVKTSDNSTIGIGAFGGCSGLVTVEISGSCDIMQEAFADCGHLAYVDFGDVGYIGNNAFLNCYSLGFVILPQNNYSIGARAFAGCTSLSTVVINYLEYGMEPFQLGKEAFMDCWALTSIVLPKHEGFTSLNYGTFRNCTSLTSIIIPNQIESIGEDAFYGCSALESLTIGTNVNMIENHAFANTALQFITELSMLPPQLGEGVFENVYSAYLTIPPFSSDSYYSDEYNWYQTIYDQSWNVEEVPDEVIDFEDEDVKQSLIEQLSDLDEDGEISKYEAMLVDRIAFSDPSSITTFDELQYFTGLSNIQYVFDGCSSLESVILPSSLSYIGDYAFNNCSSLTSVVIPENVSMIGNNAFSYSGITAISIPENVRIIGIRAFMSFGGFNGSVVLPSSLLYIGYAAFTLNNNITTVEIPNSVVAICDYAFEGCRLQHLFIPESVKKIGDSPFSRFYLRTISVAESNPVFDSRDNCNAIIKSQTNELIIGCQYTVVPNTVTSLRKEAFYGCSNNTFTSIVIPNSVVSIGEEAFYFCNYLNTITLSESLEVIGKNCFGSCHHLSSIIIPASVKSIGGTDGEAFTYCENLLSIEVDPNNMVYDSRNNCNAIIETSTNSLITGCRNTIIPNTVTTIGNYAFDGCNVLNSVTIPNSVVSIGTYAFNDCSALSNVHILNTNPPTLVYYLGYLYCFYGTSSDLRIYVPYESVDIYKNANRWKQYYASKIYPMAYTTVPGYLSTDGSWRFVSSPLIDGQNVNSVEDMISETECNYDLYHFNQSTIGEEWQNYKANPFELVNGQGYLYANKDDVTLIFKGEFNEEETKEIELVYYADKPFAGWNLVGNPFPVSAYADRSYYVMNEVGTAITPVEVSSATAIAACTGLMVKASNANETVTFSKTTPRQEPNQGTLHITVVEHKAERNKSINIMSDKAIVSFNEGDKLSKLVFNHESASLYFPLGDKKFAIAESEKIGELPLNFEAAENGRYTISVDMKEVEMSYLHLVDNLTGDDVDLLATPSHSFDAKTTDYASRFKVVFATGSSADTESFAFINGSGNLCIFGIDGEATVQVIDMLGHVISSETFNGSYEKKMDGLPGVYVLRLINGDDVKVQKVVVR